MKSLKDLPPSSQVQTKLWADADGLIHVAFEPFSPTMKVVIDPTAMASFNATLSEKLAGHNAHDPNVIGYLREFSERWLDEMWRSNYMILEDVSAEDLEGESVYKPWKYTEEKKQ